MPSFGIQVPQGVGWDGCWLQLLEEHNLMETNTKKQRCDQKQTVTGHKPSCREGWKLHYICRLGARLPDGCNHWTMGVLGSFHPDGKYPVVQHGELKSIYPPDERSEGPSSSAGTSGSPFSVGFSRCSLRGAAPTVQEAQPMTLTPAEESLFLDTSHISWSERVYVIDFEKNSSLRREEN